MTLEDVGFDTYHHTFFEMLGNWSFGDYFKKEAIGGHGNYWWMYGNSLPKDSMLPFINRVQMNLQNSILKQANYGKKFSFPWSRPEVHVVLGSKKDNFWMMGETGPCGPCSELHFDLTPEGDTEGSLVNADSHLCIEIWNLVFIQFNADKEGNFTPLDSQHVDTGMGFERVAAVIQATDGFSDFSKPVSNYDTDIFSVIFDKLQNLSGKSYQSTLPSDKSTRTKQQEIDIAFRVIGDHLRALCFSIADGILLGILTEIMSYVEYFGVQ